MMNENTYTACISDEEIVNLYWQRDVLDLTFNCSFI